MTTSQLPPEWQVKVSQIAQDFYDNDKDLTSDQRQKLYSCFRKQTFAFPFITIPVMFGAIKLPRRFFTGSKLRAAQVASGLAGVMLGSQLSQVIGYQWNLSNLPSDSHEYKCYSILGQAPPQLGLRYYGNTIKHPELAMKDPKETDWSQSPAFPLCLIFSQKPTGQRPPQHLYQRPDREAEKWRQGFEQKAKDSRDVLDKRTEFESSRQGSSWEEVRKANQALPAPSNVSTSDYSNSDSDLAKQQQQFDQLIERERQMSDGHHDDFANDEKKW